MNMRLSQLLLAVGLLGTLLLARATPVAAKMREVQRYPREANADGSFKCYPDGCSLFGLCCS
jgi:hypothetical protein